MPNLFLAGAAALALACGATAVSGQAPASGALTSQQKTAYDGWPADKKAAYDAWPAEYQAYFWSLTDTQKTGWFALTDAQRKQVYELPPASRAAAWASIEQQLAGAAGASAPATPPPTGDPAAMGATPPADQVQANPPSAEPASPTPPNPPTASTPVPPAQPADPSYNAGPYKGAMTAPPPEALNKTYPVCSKTVQDNCRNRGGK
ncbi:MAG TPA: hypothetical protein VGE05_13920 [Novosphingobium sp.]